MEYLPALAALLVVAFYVVMLRALYLFLHREEREILSALERRSAPAPRRPAIEPKTRELAHR